MRVTVREAGEDIFSCFERAPNQFRITVFGVDDQEKKIQERVVTALRHALRLAEGQPQRPLVNRSEAALNLEPSLNVAIAD